MTQDEDTPTRQIPEEQREHCIPFSNWLREHPDLPSKNISTEQLNQHVCSITDLDFIVHGYMTKPQNMMMVEVKMYGADLKFHQRDTFKVLDYMLQFANLKLAYIPSNRGYNVRYRGFHLIQFENTKPNDGETWLNGHCISEEDLLKFLRFEQSGEWYQPYFGTYGLNKTGDMLLHDPTKLL